MNVVLYTKHFEPITAIDLPLWLLDDMERKGGAKLALPARGDEDSVTTCTLLLKNVRWLDGTVKPIVIALDEEVALMLKPDWLPGQRATINLHLEYIRGLSKRLKAAMRKDWED